MRRARPLLVALYLLLALAPAAERPRRGGPDHIDTPADLRGADITRTLAIAHLTSTSPPNLTRYAPTTWCGSRLTADDSEFAAFPPTQRQIKVVYAYASGQQDRSAQWSQALQADVSNIEQYLAVQTGGARALRFDMGTECGPQYLDIQVVALPRVREYYRDDPSNFSRLAHDVAAAVGSLSGPRDVFVLADKLTDDPVWGIAQVIDDDRGGAENESNAGGLTAIMWTNPSTQPDPSDWWQPTVMLHEITHNLGGVQQSAPHHTSNWHCTDGEDVMCYPDGSPEAAGLRRHHLLARRRRDPADLRLRPRRLLQPGPGPGELPRRPLERLPQRLHGHLRLARHGMRIGRGAGSAGQHGGADARRSGRGWAHRSRPGPERGSTRRPATHCAGSGPPTPAGSTSPEHRDPTYLPTDADVGAALRVTVTATNADGAAIAASPPPSRSPGTPRRRPASDADAEGSRDAAARPSEHLPARPRRTMPRARSRHASSRSRPGARCAPTRSRSR